MSFAKSSEFGRIFPDLSKTRNFKMDSSLIVLWHFDDGLRAAHELGFRGDVFETGEVGVVLLLSDDTFIEISFDEADVEVLLGVHFAAFWGSLVRVFDWLGTSYQGRILVPTRFEASPNVRYRVKLRTCDCDLLL